MRRHDLVQIRGLEGVWTVTDFVGDLVNLSRGNTYRTEHRDNVLPIQEPPGGLVRPQKSYRNGKGWRR